jgi:hypothetical protein
MGLRSLERKLAPEICYQIVAEAVDEYLRRSGEAGHLLGPVENLKMPILRAGFQPAGLQEAIQKLALRLPRRRLRVSRRLEVEVLPPVDDSDKPLRLPRADRLIEEIFWPYPVGGLRKHRERRARAFGRGTPL